MPKHITAHEAKRIIKARLSELGMPAYRLTSQTVSFADLARDRKVFVYIHGYRPDYKWTSLLITASANNFIIESRYP